MRKKFSLGDEVKGHTIEIGRLIIKTAGRDAGKIGVVVDILDDKTVLIDGHVRRRKCNVSHLETLDKTIKIKPNATTDAIVKELKSVDIEVKKRKPKERKERLKKVRKAKEAKPEIVKAKKEEKKAEKTAKQKKLKENKKPAKTKK